MEAVFLTLVGSTMSTTFAIISLTLAVGFSGFAISGNCYQLQTLTLKQIQFTLSSINFLRKEPFRVKT